MRTLMYVLAAVAVMGLAFWAYNENYRTQSQIDEMQIVQNEIASLRENLGVLRAEWAYLNRPERLRELVDINFDKLRLAPVQSGQFGGPRNIDYPDPNAIPDPDNPDVMLQPPRPSNNRGAPQPRPLRPASANAEASATQSADEPTFEGELSDDEQPADTALTETEE